MENVCVLYFSRSQYNSRACLLKKKLSLHGAAPSRQNFKAVIFSSGRLLHPPSTVLPICLRTARARLTNFLRAVTLRKNVLGFNLPQRVSLFFSLDLVLRISEFGPVLY